MGFTDKGYRCDCPEEYGGERCHEGISGYNYIPKLGERLESIKSHRGSETKPNYFTSILKHIFRRIVDYYRFRAK